MRKGRDVVLDDVDYQVVIEESFKPDLNDYGGYENIYEQYDLNPVRQSSS